MHTFGQQSPHVVKVQVTGSISPLCFSLKGYHSDNEIRPLCQSNQTSLKQTTSWAYSQLVMACLQAALGVTVVPLLDGPIEKQIAKAGPKRQQACRQKIVVRFSKNLFVVGWQSKQDCLHPGV